MQPPFAHGPDRLLRQHYLFSLLPAERFSELASRIRLIELAAGERLFTQGDAADRFFLVAEGQIKLFRTTPEGHEKVIEIMSAGRSFAEAVMFMHHQCYPASAEALKTARVYAIPSVLYLQLLRDNPELCFGLLGSLSMRLHQRVNEIETLSLQNAGCRLARYLLQHLPPKACDGAEIQLPAAKQVIASQLGITPETLSRLLRSFSEAGKIEVRASTVVVKDLQGLAAIS